MSLNVFLTICVLGCDFLIYAFFQWTFGEKYRRRARKSSFQKLPRKNAIEFTAIRPYVLGSPVPHQRARQTERSAPVAGREVA